MTNPPEVDEAIDNDVLLKAVRYCLVALLWPEEHRLGVLGAARFVVGKRLESLTPARPEAVAELKGLLDRALVLEPSEDEVAVAADLERQAQELALPLDSGESQLAAIAVTRAISLITTGDKRAIVSLQVLLAHTVWLQALCGRVRSLEQLVLGALEDEGFARLATAICADREADKALSTCFSCFGGTPTPASAEAGLRSYIDDLRKTAPDVMVVEP
jgi:hypothetical protein